jgi:outer membrane murein-binding lipoprotein Lpp
VGLTVWGQAPLSWLPTLAVVAMTVLALLAAIAPPPHAGKSRWIAAIVLCGAVAIAAAAWQQREELAQLRDLSSHLRALARLLPGGPPISPEETVDSLATSMASLNARIDELQHQIEVLREKSRGRTIDADTAAKMADHLRPLGNYRVVLSCVPDDIEAFTYANQLANVLRSAGWDALGPETTTIFGAVPAIGITLYVRAGVTPGAAKILIDAFARFNIPYKSGVSPSDAIPDPATVELFVGPKG